jgi:oligopeptide transport system substrate-binding protein
MRRWREAPTLLASLALVTALLLVLLAGCAPAWPFPQPTADPKVPDAQQIFRPLEIGPNAGDLATLDPALINFAVDEDKAQLLFPALVTLDAQGKPVDWAAERHEVSVDGLTYTFHLHNDMAWSDGTPITATTFAYSINRALDPCTGSDVASYLYNITGAANFNGGKCPAGATQSADTLVGKSIVVADPLTLRLTLERPAGSFLAALTYPTSWAAPKHLIDQYADQWTEHLTDNGGFGGNLFKLTSWVHASQLVFARNERFWGQKALLKEVQYTLYKDTGHAWAAYKEGAGDVGYPLATELEVAKGLKGSTFQQVPQLAFSYLTPNWRLAPFDDVRVRQAFSLALDRQTIAHDILKDTAQPTIHLIPDGIPGYNPDVMDASGRKGKEALTPDLATARRLVNEYAAEKCGGQIARCPAVSMLISANRPTTMETAQSMKQQWEAAFPSLSVTIKGIDRSGFPIYYQIANAGWGADYPDPQDFVSLLWTTQASYNRTAVSIPQVDALCTQADGMSDLNARIPLYQQAEQLLVNQVAAIPYAQPLWSYVVRSRVVGWWLAPTGETPLRVWQATYLTR